MQIRMLKAWQSLHIGDVWAPGDGVANVLIDRNLAVVFLSSEEGSDSSGPSSVNSLTKKKTVKTRSKKKTTKK